MSVLVIVLRIWIRDKFKLKIDLSVKTSWQEYGVVAGSWFDLTTRPMLVHRRVLFASTLLNTCVRQREVQWEWSVSSKNTTQSTHPGLALRPRDLQPSTLTTGLSRLPIPYHTEQYILTLTDSSSSYSPSKSNKALAFGVRLSFFIVDSARYKQTIT